MNTDKCIKMICKRAAEMWESPDIRKHVFEAIEKPITEEKIQEYMYNLALYTLYVPQDKRK